MHAPETPRRDTYDYAVIRVVPRVEREEFVNVGILLSCPPAKFLEARIEVDEARLLALDPDIDLETVRRHLGRCLHAGNAVEHLMDRMVRVRRA